MSTSRPARERGPSLVRRLVLLAAAWSLGVLAIAGVSLSLFFSHAATTRIDDELSDTVDSLLAGTSFEGGEVTPPGAVHDSKDKGQRAYSVEPKDERAFSGDYWEIATPDGTGGLKALATSRSLFGRALAPPAEGLRSLTAAQGKTLFYDAAGPLDQSLRVGAAEARIEGYPAAVIFMAAEDRTPVDRDVRTFVTTLAVALGILGAGLVAAVIIQVRVGLRPLFALRREVAEVRTGRRERLEGVYPVEVAPLARELNALVAHNQEVVERQRTHVGNLAHALKTPLSVLLAEAGGQAGELAGLVRRQAGVMSQQVDHHLRRARAAARTEGMGERTPVAPVLEELVRVLERIFQDKIEDIDFDCPEGLMFVGERQDLLEIAGNVLENACKYGRRQVRATCVPGPRVFTLSVEDDGPGLAADQRETVLRRGERLDESAPGSGLGLSIADDLARAYGGAVTLGESELGGLKVTITLPRAEL
jgi:signal transduction histidine kinase